MASHKRTTALMLGSLVLGVVLAVGHHLYYTSLDGKAVESSTQQEWFFRVGTGLAFLARAMLSASAAVAYTQMVWRTLRTRPVSVEGIDALFGVLDDAWAFGVGDMWRAAPMLGVVGVVAWALPLIAVVTPATLTVRVSPQLNSTTISSRIPVPDYANTANFAHAQYTSSGSLQYTSPSTAISRLLLSIASTGALLDMPAPYANSSYSTQFLGPAIECGVPDNASFVETASELVQNSTCCGNKVGYVGFVPSSTAGGTYLANGTAEDYALLGLKGALNSSLVSSMASLDSTGKGAAKFYVTVPPGLDDVYTANKTIQCSLWNASYAVNFSFSNGEQDVSFRSTKLNPQAAEDVLACTDVDECQGSIAYMSLFDALGKLLLGSLSVSQSLAISPVRTQMMSSVLMDSTEMKAFRSVDSSINMSMADALEQVFANATMSMFARSTFLQNDSEASRGLVTYWTAQNAYSYAPRDLLIAYALGVVATTALCIAGLVCISSSEASYKTSFSTMLRTTRNPDLDAIVPTAETSGAGPLSKELRKTRLILQRGRIKDGEDQGDVTFFAVSPETAVDDANERPPCVESLEPRIQVYSAPPGGRESYSLRRDDRIPFSTRGDASLRGSRVPSIQGEDEFLRASRMPSLGGDEESPRASRVPSSLIGSESGHASHVSPLSSPRGSQYLSPDGRGSQYLSPDGRGRDFTRQRHGSNEYSSSWI